jgi:YD repeat-containing protein
VTGDDRTPPRGMQTGPVPTPGVVARAPARPGGAEGKGKDDFLVQAPSVSVPKGGGAVRGITEKFQANPVTGTAGLSVPIALTPARGALELALSYDSGSGGGPFGHGWKVALPSIRRKTDKGLPRYRDRGDDADVFVFSEAEDLVLGETLDGALEASRTATFDTDDYRVEQFRPRTEGAFTRIERWTRTTDGYAWWRTVGRDNTERVYGRSANARVVDPDRTERCFEWLAEEVRDEVGNVTQILYAHEDRAGAPNTPAEAARRLPGNTPTFVYPKRVRYANRTPFAAAPLDSDFFVEVVFDYGEHTTDTVEAVDLWPCRPDLFSSFRSGFDLRCYRLCRRILVFHRHSSLGEDPVLVRATELTLDEQPHLSRTTAITHRGYRTDGSTTDEALPAVSFTYTDAELGQQVEWFTGVEDLPPGFDTARWQWVDLDGEGIQGLLTEQGQQWWWKRNEGEGRLGALQRLDARPSGGLQGASLQDLGGDGRLDLVRTTRPLAGYHERGRDGSWGPLRPFQTIPDVSPSDPNVRMLDLDGDGHVDVLVTENDALRWYPSLGKDGYDRPLRVPVPTNDDHGPRVVFASERETLFLADMVGDGLTDLVRVRNGEVCYWPNKGYGQFGAKTVLTGSPWLDAPDRFDPKRVRLVDIDGSGPTDLVYLGPDCVRMWRNASGNGFGEEIALTRLPGVHDAATVTTGDVRGDGTGCLVWSSRLLSDSARPLRYVRLQAAGKPHLLKSYDNGLGRVTTLTYASSTKFYLADRRAGAPWATRLHFPVQCLEKVEVYDAVTGWRFANTYSYHHGAYDGPEREFRGFGRVDQRDAEAFSDFASDPGLVFYAPPKLVRSWFHTGVWRDEPTLEAAYAAEYFPDQSVGRCVLPAGNPNETREAARALKGKLLRQEVYADDGTELAGVPYQVTSSRYEVRRVQTGVYLTVPLETRTAAYERDTDDPRVQHSLTLGVDPYGEVLLAATVGYPRRGTGHPSAQWTCLVTVTEREVVHDVASADHHHLGLPSSERVWELVASATDEAPFTPATLQTAFAGATTVSYGATPTTDDKRLLGETQTRYWNDGLTAALSLGSVGARALVHSKHQLAYPVDWVGTPLPDAADADLEGAGYVQLVTDGDWYRPSGTSTLDAAHFYHPTAVTDPFGNVTTLTWDADDLLPESVEDALGNVVTADNDYQALTPHTVTDPNGTAQQVAFDPLGRVVKTAIVGPAAEGDSLTHPTTEITYNLATLPASATVVSREVHYAESTTTRFQTAVAYSDGGGNVVQTKTTAAPSQWVGTGRVQVDNKGNPVRQYEPFFSATSDYEDEDEVVATGVSVTLTYDALSRKIRADHPDGTFETVEYATWSQTTSDRCDTVLDSDWYADRSSSSDPLVVRSVARSTEHAETPSVAHVDVLGRPFRTVETPDGTEEYVTDTVLDLLGRTTAVIDARGNTTQADVFDAMGRSVHSTSPDAGETRVLLDVAGQPVRTWKSGGVVITQTYDALRRPRATFDGTRVHVFNVYGEFDDTDHARGRLWRQYDGAGLVELGYDFAGNGTSSTRTFLDDVDTEVNWLTLLDDVDLAALDATAAGDLQGSGFTTTTTFDALKRVVTSTTPDDSVTRNTWDEGGRLSAVDVQIRGSSTWTPMVGAITHDAKGQRTRIEYPGFATDYTYDAETFRLVRLETVRDSDDAVLQDLTYTYDAAGNIVQISDAAQQTLFFDNSVVSPTTKYKYDALYRLLSAEGREHGSLAQPAHGDPALGDLPHDNDGSAVRTYLETYVYDEVGNILRMKHQGGTEASPGSVLWHRGYHYATGSNVLLKTSLPGDDVEDPDTYSATAYDVNDRGALVEMPHLAGITRQFDDQMRGVDLGSGDDAVYHYDAAGQRVRKVVRTGATTKERLYVGAWERFQRSTTTLQEERDTLHVMDDRRRIVMIETLTVDSGTAVSTPVPRQRFQLGNHLDSAALEVDEDGALITYEEYHPFGTTSWWASNGLDRRVARNATATRARRRTRRRGSRTTGLGTTRRGWGGGRGLIRSG